MFSLILAADRMPDPVAGPHKKGTPRMRPHGRFAILTLLAFFVFAAPSAASRRRTEAAPRVHGAAQTDLTRKEPYLLYTGFETEMKVVWQLTSTATCSIAWGPDTTYAMGSAQTSEYGSDHQHAYTITGLAPATKYYYRVTTPDVPHSGSFVTAPPASEPDLMFFAYGDTRSYPATHDQVAARMLADIAADPARQTLAVATGDLVLNGDSETDWTSQFFSSSYPNIRRLLATVPFQSAKGNHEESGSLFVKYFPYPFVSGRYWSFDYGPAHFTVVDQYTAYGSGSAQLQWITDDLRNSTKPWKFIVLHEPGWSAGGDHENNPTVQTYIQPLCIQYGVSIVFGGHNHYYARAVVNGVTHITTGGGGAPLYQPNPSYPYIVTCASVNHYCRVTIQGSVLTCEAVTPAGAIVDSFTLQSPATVPVQPQTLTLEEARPNPFTSETLIRWRTTDGNHSSLVILDVAGRRVRTFQAKGPGWHSVRWDGKNDAGRPMGSGLYFYREQPWNSTAEGKVFLVR
jgi:hypothetical protein